MSTRSLIGRLNEDGTVNYVYCHFDGYLEGVGSRIDEYYQDKDKVDSLLALGSISSLGAEIGEKHDFDWQSHMWDKYGYEVSDYPEDVLAEFHRLDKMTLSYHRDRGERLFISTAATVAEYWAANSGTEYWYLYQNGEWWVKIYDRSPQLLSEALLANDEDEDGDDEEDAA